MQMNNNNNADWLEMYGTSVSHTKCYAKATGQETLIYKRMMERIIAEIGDFVICTYMERINPAEEYTLIFGLTAPAPTVSSARRHRQLLEIADAISRECEIEVSIGITFTPQSSKGTFLIFDSKQALEIAHHSKYDNPENAIVALLCFLCFAAESEQRRPSLALDVFCNLSDAYRRIGEWRLALTCLDEAEELFKELNGKNRDENCHSSLDRLLSSFVGLSVPERGIALVKEVMPNLPPVELISPYDSEELHRAFDLQQSLDVLEEMTSEYSGKNRLIMTWGQAQRVC